MDLATELVGSALTPSRSAVQCSMQVVLPNRNISPSGYPRSGFSTNRLITSNSPGYRMTVNRTLDCLCRNCGAAWSAALL